MCKSALRWMGGKSRAVKQIEAQFPKQTFEEYREPFVGGGSVFLHAASLGMASQYWINDAHFELVCFWLAVQDKTRCERLLDQLVFWRDTLVETHQGKRLFQMLRGESPVVKDLSWVEIERWAAKLFYLNRVSFSGSTESGGFSSHAFERRFTYSSLERVAQLHDFIQPLDTTVTCGSFTDVLVATGNNVFIFADPPYPTAAKLYGKNGDLHDDFDHELLASILKLTPHKFLLTYSDCDYIRDLYSWANIEEWSVQYGSNNVGGKGCAKGKELFIKNY